eukprot:INCI1271.1.p1 GENE.INCI1271.1~~INCI1271.1.p1  ORF type:complete len:222 (+),score=47.24 INCI1271.1:331-996(+)
MAGSGSGLTEDYVLEKMLRSKGALLWSKEASLDQKESIVKEYMALHPQHIVKGYNAVEKEATLADEFNQKIAAAVEAEDFELAAELRRQRDAGEDERIQAKKAPKKKGFLAKIKVAPQKPRRTVFKSFRAAGLKGRPGMGQGQVPTFVGRQNFTVVLSHGSDDHLPKDRFGNPIHPPKKPPRYTYAQRDVNAKKRVPWRDQKEWNWPLSGKPVIEDPRAQK